jgi:hypothetical protein
VQKERLQERRYGVCIQRLVNWAVVAQKKYPIKPILAPKINYKSAYQQGILHFRMALKTATQLPDDLIAIIMLRLTFSGIPCPFEWGIILETVFDLANKLLKCKTGTARLTCISSNEHPTKKIFG